MRIGAVRVRFVRARVGRIFRSRRKIAQYKSPPPANPVPHRIRIFAHSHIRAFAYSRVRILAKSVPRNIRIFAYSRIRIFRGTGRAWRGMARCLHRAGMARCLHRAGMARGMLALWPKQTACQSGHNPALCVRVLWLAWDLQGTCSRRFMLTYAVWLE
jgi:hypothetical protein